MYDQLDIKDLTLSQRKAESVELSKTAVSHSDTHKRDSQMQRRYSRTVSHD